MARATQSVILEWLSKGEDKVSKKAQLLQKDLTKVNKSWGVMAKKALIAGTVMVATTGLIVAQAGKFEQAMADATAVTAGLTDVQFRDMQAMAKKTGQELGISADKIARGFYFLGSAGFTATEQLRAFPEVAKLAVAGNIDMAESAETVADTLRGFGLKADQTSRVVDVMAKAVVSSNQTFGQLGKTLSLVAGVADSAGWSLEQTVAVTEMLANVGIKGTRSGTALRRAILNLQAPTEETRKALEGLGVSVFDADGNARDAIDVFGDLSEALNEGTQEQRMFALRTIFGARAIAGMTKVVASGEVGLRKLTKELENAGGTADEIVAKKMDTLNGAIKRLRATMNVLWIELGAELIPKLTTLAKSATNLVSKLQSMSPPMKSLIMNIGLFGGAGLIAVGILGKLAIGIVGLNMLMPILIAKIGLAKLALGGWITLIAIGVISIGKIAVKIAELVKAHKNLRKAEEERQEMEKKALMTMNEWTVFRLKNLKDERLAYNLAFEFAKNLRRRLKKDGKNMTLDTQRELRFRADAYTEFYKSLEGRIEELDKKETKKREKDKQKSEEEIANLKAVQDTKLQLISTHSARVSELETQLDEELELLGATEFQREIFMLEKEKQAKQNAFQEELSNLRKAGATETEIRTRQAEYNVQLNEWEQQRVAQIERFYRTQRLNAVLDTTAKMITASLQLLEVDKDTTANELRLTKSLIVAQQALAIARLWATEAKKGILGLATATVGTVAILATMTKQTDALDEAYADAKQSIEAEPIRPTVEMPDMAVAPPPGADQGVARLSPTGAPRATPVAQARPMTIQIGKIIVQFNVGAVKRIDEDTLSEQLNKIALAVKDRTIEGIRLAINVRDEIARQEGLA